MDFLHGNTRFPDMVCVGKLSVIWFKRIGVNEKSPS